MRATATIAIITAILSCVARSEKINNEGLISTDTHRQKREAVQNPVPYPISPGLEKGLIFFEDKRKNASDGDAFSLMTRAYQSCAKDCTNGTYLEGSCPMDCRAHYLALEVKKLEAQLASLTSTVEKLEVAQNAPPTLGIIILVMAVIGMVGICIYVYVNDRKTKKILREEMKQRQPYGHPTSTQQVEPGENVRLYPNVDEERAERGF